MLWLVLLSQIQKFHWRRNNGLKLSLHAKGLSRYAISHFNIFRPRIHTFPIQIGHLTTKELKINELYSGMIKISLVFNNRKRKENAVFLSLASHMLITVWLLMMFLAKWKKMLMLLKMNKKGKKSRQREKSCHHKVSIPVPSAWDKCYPLHHTCKLSLGLKTSFQSLDLISLKQNFQNIKSM